MFQVLQPELLDALRRQLQDMENIKLFPADDIEILRVKRTLRQKINDLESECSNDYCGMAA
jgi:hypothetical protein